MTSTAAWRRGHRERAHFLRRPGMPGNEQAGEGKDDRDRVRNRPGAPGGGTEPGRAVQFESLKLAFDTLSGGDQSGGSASSSPARARPSWPSSLGSRSAPCPTAWATESPRRRAGQDVRKLTAYVVRLMRPAAPTDKNKKTGGAVPAVRFKWGAFQFDGIVESERDHRLLHPEGHALRSSYPCR